MSGMGIFKSYKERRAQKLAQKEAFKKGQREKELAKLKASTRSAQKIEDEYNKILITCGELQFRCEVMKQEMSQHNQKLFGLKRELMEAQRVEKMLAKPEEPPAPAPASPEPQPAPQTEEPSPEVPNEGGVVPYVPELIPGVQNEQEACTQSPS